MFKLIELMVISQYCGSRMDAASGAMRTSLAAVKGRFAPETY